MTQSAAIVGLGRIGLPLAISFADRGVDVIGVDKDRARLDTVGEGRMPFEEPGAQELLDRVLPGGDDYALGEVVRAQYAGGFAVEGGPPAGVPAFGDDEERGAGR